MKIIKIFILGSAVLWDLFTTLTQAKIREIVGQTAEAKNELDKPN